jgi:hypothetical protein
VKDAAQVKMIATHFAELDESGPYQCCLRVRLTSSPKTGRRSSWKKDGHSGYLDFMLLTPTVDLVEAECREFDRENSLIEEALGQLRTQFPRNADPSHVLLKVLVLNQLYSTRINSIDIEPLSRYIAGLGIDTLLGQGSPSAVDRITLCPNLRRYLSFASKFCSWHNPAAYRIYDGNARACLWSYKKQDQFAKFHLQDLWYYEKFRATVVAFSAFYGLDRLTLKHLGKFLWRSGDRILRGVN